jgi:hypothetical protein
MRPSFREMSLIGCRVGNGLSTIHALIIRRAADKAQIGKKNSRRAA